MSLAITRRTVGLLATLAASACTLGAAASAQATPVLTITSPADGGYSNSLSPTVHFTGATPGDTVTLSSSNNGNPDGSVVADNSGAGSITPPNPVASGQNFPYTLTATETGSNQATATAQVTFDNVPSISGSGTFVDASGVSLSASNAIPSEPVHTSFTPLPSGSAMNVSTGADAFGGASGISPSGPLAPGEYQAAMTTIDSNSIASGAAIFDFYVAPAQPTFVSPTDGENINQSAPTVTVSGVLSGATVALYTVDDQGQSVLLDHTTASADGNVTFTTLSGLADGAESLFAVQTIDENGTQVSSDGGTSANTPPSSAAYISVNVDTAAPDASFEYGAGATTKDTQPFFFADNGPVDRQGDTSGVEFILTGPNRSLNSGLVQTDGGGDASWQPTTALPDGTYSISAYSVDDTGHVGAAQSNSVSFTVNTAAPAPTTSTSTTTSTPAPKTTSTSTTTTTTTTTTAPTPKPTPRPQAPGALTLSSHHVSAGHPVRLGFSLSKPGMVTEKLMHNVHGKSKVVGTVLVKVTKAGHHSIVLTTRFAGHKLVKGSYTLSLRAGTGTNVSAALKAKLTVG